jgi:uncharacterized protein
MMRDRFRVRCKGVRFVCNGGCPKNRFIRTPDGAPGLNWLCEGYQSFFNHIDPAMCYMAKALGHRRPPAGIMRALREGADPVLAAAYGAGEVTPA